MRLGVDASGFDLDAPLPEIPQTNASQSGRDTLVALARRDNLTVRQLAQMVGGYGGLQMVGTPGEIAQLGNQNTFYRLRLGIGHPGVASMVSNFVLGRAPRAEQEKLDASIDFALGVLPDIFAGEWNRAMKNLHSQKA